MSRFADQLNRRLLVFDGAMGTQVHALGLDLEADYLGRENCPEVLNLSRPEVIQSIHEAYLLAGADVVETNTFGGNEIVLAEFGLADRCREINRAAAEAARRAAERYSCGEQPRFVAGALGPGTKLVTLGQTTWDQMLASYTVQARGLLEGGVDVLLIETAQDLLQVKCALNACLDALAERKLTPADVPLMVQVTVETNGTMLVGSPIEVAATALASFPILSLGLNCATGPTEMLEHVHWLGRHWDRPVSVQPNAGLPALVDGRAQYPLAAAPFAQAMLKFVQEAGVRIVGGCCGTTPAHIAELVRLLVPHQPGRVEKTAPAAACCSLYDVTDYRQDTSILNVGERTNASGSRAFKRLLETEDFDAMVSLAREQIREGSHLVDVNVDYAGRDNARDMTEIVRRFVRQVNVPLMLDSTQPATLEAGLKCAGGKCVINSANLEEGPEKFDRLVRLAQRYGAALVLGTIDEDPQEAMARTAERKSAIARRMHARAVKTLGFDERDIFFDPLVLPISTGMEKDRRSALETIAGVRRIAAEFPRCQIVVGLSNVSFGLKAQARVVLNSVFLHELVQAGLTAAILHSSKILPRSRIPDAQWAAALELIHDRRDAGDPLQRFIALFPDADAAPPAPAEAAARTLEERLRRHIIDGEKRGLAEALEEARGRYSPLQIINDHLLDGMKTVGELFGSGQMQLPFVLQSAEVMKAAVAQLEPHMDRFQGQAKGSIVLATVKGDVHDIGKNLVDIILSNNGYRVVNLGIKQPISTIIDAWQRERADAIGLSGLLVKSVQVMKENLEELNSRGITAPVLLGGAALSRHYCESDLRAGYGGKAYYGRDAFEGLRIMEHLTGGRAAVLDAEVEDRLAKRAAVEQKLATAAGARDRPAAAPALVTAAEAAPPPAVPRLTSGIPQPPFWGDRVVESVDLARVFAFINRVALFRGQWQFRKGRRTDQEYEAQVRDQIEPLFARLTAEAHAQGWLSPRVVYGYYPCNSEGDDLVVFDPRDPGREAARFRFPRQATRERLCISDYFLPLDAGRRDVLALQCVTVGPEASRRSRALFEADRYQDYLYLHGLSVEAAEGLAELWHQRVRQELGVAGDDAPNVRELFAKSYRGCRYSFGYPACPDMSDQQKLFALLRPERIGCRLTENWQIDPEQSTSALIVHHPAAKYFNV